MEIGFQNENLVAWQNGEVVCSVPDLITILNLDDGEPIGTEMLRADYSMGYPAAVHALMPPRSRILV